MVGGSIVKAIQTHSKMRAKNAKKRFEDFNADYHLPTKKTGLPFVVWISPRGKLRFARKPGNPNWCQWLSCQTFVSLKV